MTQSIDRQFPIGKFQPNPNLTSAERASLIKELERYPDDVRQAIQILSMDVLDSSYREGSWTRRQVVHHIADAHLNFYMRVKLALTESNPTIKPFDEQGWAKLANSTLPVEASLLQIEGTVARLVALFSAMDDADYAKTFHHPANGHNYPLSIALGIVVWHGNHHLAQVKLPL